MVNNALLQYRPHYMYGPFSRRWAQKELLPLFRNGNIMSMLIAPSKGEAFVHLLSGTPFLKTACPAHNVMLFMALGPSPLPKGDQLMIATWPILTTLWPNGAPVCDAKRRSLQPLSEHSLFLSSSSVNYSAAFFFSSFVQPRKREGGYDESKSSKRLISRSISF